MLVVDKNTFKTEVLENEGYVLVDFFGDGCEPCAALMPKVEALGEKYGDKIKFTKINTTKIIPITIAIKLNMLGASWRITS